MADGHRCRLRRSFKTPSSAGRNREVKLYVEGLGKNAKIREVDDLQGGSAEAPVAGKSRLGANGGHGFEAPLAPSQRRDLRMPAPGRIPPSGQWSAPTQPRHLGQTTGLDENVRARWAAMDELLDGAREGSRLRLRTVARPGKILQRLGLTLPQRSSQCSAENQGLKCTTQCKLNQRSCKLRRTDRSVVKSRK